MKWKLVEKSYVNVGGKQSQEGALDKCDIRMFSMFWDAYRVDVPSQAGGHGGDLVMLNDLFATASIGMAMTSSNLPEEEGDAARIKHVHAELRLGIHGEAGAQTLPTINNRELIEVMVDKFSAHFPVKGPVTELINNLGGVSSLEISALTKELVHSLCGAIAWAILSAWRR